ncbi:hypothetical protein IFU23_06430 [Pantoea agglomerans]|uniref:Uncharacterized protein n=1 Tax=Enterobacter agglomerans TaxID=549 RepID=A0ACC5PVM0_ENTAG|nr:hypothetical protein [Pantoea agglomerans]MBD8129099.1 hypothetical protein [Pantoea agglomerans]MBD8153809.1 hypothetical protein [Pantoea agglomerans]MBD8157743.1 hypothetical protein [Pantoea agglomerans]MBD8231582.1 hypothetical protein [Pantoea agglomerans]MBD8241723.1 hypothetical protein [Pantoea agglomerans]
MGIIKGWSILIEPDGEPAIELNSRQKPHTESELLVVPLMNAGARYFPLMRIASFTVTPQLENDHEILH